MFTAILAAITAALSAVPRIIDLWQQQIAINKADAQLRWAQALQTGLAPLEQGQPTSDAQKAAAVKSVADAWANMPT